MLFHKFFAGCQYFIELAAFLNILILLLDWEGPRRTSMLASLLTLLLGKVAEAWLMHAKACN